MAARIDRVRFGRSDATFLDPVGILSESRNAKGIAMSMGRRPSEEQGELWIPTAELPRSPGHVFYDKLNRFLGDAGFDRHLEALCRPHYADELGRTSIPPGVYFRMLLVGYFEGIDSQRG